MPGALWILVHSSIRGKRRADIASTGRYKSIHSGRNYSLHLVVIFPVSISHELDKTMKKLIVITLTSVALIASIITPARADHGETILGAVIGTTVGAVIGNDIGGRRGVVVGAVIGAATGATVGHNVGHRRYERVEYYSEPVYHHPRPVERVVYVPDEEPRVVYAPPRREYDDCEERDHGRRNRHHGHDRDDHERRHWNR